MFSFGATSADHLESTPSPWIGGQTGAVFYEIDLGCLESFGHIQALIHVPIEAREEVRRDLVVNIP